MESTSRCLMIIGAGKLGGPVLDVLSSRYPHHRYVLVARDAERTTRRLNLTRYMCSQWGQYPDLQPDSTNLLNTDQAATVIERHRPDVVFNATTPFPWWRIAELPEPQRKLAKAAGPGVWCALDCLLPANLSCALEAARSPATFVNGCYPDAVNPFLGERGCSPTLGIGNLSNLVPGLRLALARTLSAEPREVDIRLVCHHYTSLNAPSGDGRDAPYQLTVDHRGSRQRFATPDDTPFALLAATVGRTRGLSGQGVTISSAATVLATLLNREQRRHHAPGPLGLPGGYPVDISESGSVTLDLPHDTSVSEAIQINTAAQCFDGIQTVNPGSITPTERAREAYAAIVGSHLPTVTPDNMLALSRDAIERINASYHLGLAL
jgi:hypothetical protein